ncbi:hypothetical protein ACF1BE_11765 [Streptomyces sp. NPDC014991]|uniref:hypothetical protein n=1 Tax=Streptomyces sp. NPDC014991 TaxID=3364935 RepID=UPI0036F85CF8
MPDTTAPAVGGSPRGSRARPPGPSLPGTVPVPAGTVAGLPARTAAPLTTAGTAVRRAVAERNKRKGISVFRPIFSISVIGGAAGPRPDTV